MGFKGFDAIGNLEYKQKVFQCKSCDNLCDVTEISTSDEKLFCGDRCEKFSGAENYREGAAGPFDDREKALMHYQKDPSTPNAVIGIPRVGMFYDLFPLWATFFQKLNMKIVPSEKTNKRIIKEGLERTTADFCFPFKVAFGHFADLDGKVDYIYAPDVVEGFGSKYLEDGEERFCGWDRNVSCPYLHTFGTVVARNVSSTKVINPVISLRESEKVLVSELRKSFLNAGLNFDFGEIKDAYAAGVNAFTGFKKKLRELGEGVLDSLGKDKGIVVVARPYSAFDEEMNLRLARKISQYGFTPIPMDFLPLPEEDLSKIWTNEFSIQGQAILNSARVIKKKNLNAVFVDYFGCGPNSFIKGFFAREVGKPFLVLQIDEHTADAGLVTRLEAFLDSLNSRGKSGK